VAEINPSVLYDWNDKLITPNDINRIEEHLVNHMDWISFNENYSEVQLDGRYSLYDLRMLLAKMEIKNDILINTVVPVSILHNLDGTVMTHEEAVKHVDEMKRGAGGVYMRDKEIMAFKRPTDTLLMDGDPNLQQLKAMVVVLETNITANNKGK